MSKLFTFIVVQIVHHVRSPKILTVIRLNFTTFCSEYDNSFSFSSPTDDWPSMSSSQIDDMIDAKKSRPLRRGPINAIRRVAGLFVEGGARFPHS